MFDQPREEKESVWHTARHTRIRRAWALHTYMYVCVCVCMWSTPVQSMRGTRDIAEPNIGASFLHLLWRWCAVFLDLCRRHRCRLPLPIWRLSSLTCLPGTAAAQVVAVPSRRVYACQRLSLAKGVYRGRARIGERRPHSPRLTFSPPLLRPSHLALTSACASATGLVWLSLYCLLLRH